MKRKEQILEYFYLGLDYKDIAEKVGVTKNTVHRNIKSMGLKSTDRQKPHKSRFDETEIGCRYGNLIIVGSEYIEKSQTWCAKCVCDCGADAVETLRKLKNGERKTCGLSGCKYHVQLKRDNGKKMTTGYEDILGSVWAVWRIGAEKRNIDFEITIEDAWDKFIEQNRKCALSGVELVFRKGKNRTQTASLDRIDSKKQYTKDNIQWVHKVINIMKGNLDEQEFIVYCKKIAKWKNN